MSPHLDDAALSCGSILSLHPGGVVLTVLAGHPADWSSLSPWDRRCGFLDGQDVVAARKREDVIVLEMLGSTALWLDHLDLQYRRQPLDLELVADDVVEALSQARARSVLFPIGLFHPDHQDVRDACLRAMERYREADWYAYDELPYLYQDDGTAESRKVRTTRFRRYRLSPVEMATPTPSKLRAVPLYASQRRGLGEAAFGRALSGPESYWRVRPRTPAARLARLPCDLWRRGHR